MIFKMFAAFVHGKKYRERGLPCQDFAEALEFDTVQAIAVADGHGGKDYFRSDTGSRLAVEVAFEQIKTFCDDTTNYKIFSENGIRSFEFKLWEEWRKAVKADWDKRLAAVFELGEDEPRWENVSDKYKERYNSTDEKILERYIPVAYGTTLICAVSIGSQVLIVQVGDGSCVILQRNGEFKVPVPPDNENFANVTTSLCDADAYKKFRHVVLDCAEDSPLAPVAIFLSTDGLDDCYPISDNEQFLYKLYADAVIDSMINNGFEKTQEELRLELLPYMTEHGSNDDISLAYLVTEDLNLLKNTLEKFPAPVNETASTTVNQQVSDPVNETASTTVNQQVSDPVNETASTTANQQVSDLVNETASTTANQQVSDLVNETASTTANQQVSDLVNETASTTANQQVSDLVNETASTTANQQVSDLVNETASTTANQQVSDPVNETASTTVNQQVSDLVNETASTTTNQQVSDLVNETASTTANQQVSDPVNETDSEPIDITPGKMLQATKERLAIEKKKMIESANATQIKIAEEAALVRERLFTRWQGERGNKS